MFSSISNRLQRIGAKRLVIATGFVVAMIAATGLGLATKQATRAASYDCDNNAILRCGAANAREFINDVNSNNKSVKYQGDLKKIYASGYANLPETEYERFAKYAKNGYVDNKGRVVVGGKVVMTGAWSMGRQSFGNPQRKAIDIGGTTYYKSPTSVSFADGVTSLPVMVLFNDKGIAQSAIMNACGNPVWGTTPTYSCNALKSEKVDGDTNRYWTEVSATGGATVSRVVYDFDNGVKIEKKNPAEKFEYTHPSAGKYSVKVTVYFNLPGYGEVAVPPVKCLKQVEIVKPFYACDALEGVALNNEKTKFRFTVKARAGNGATLKDADFTLDDKSTTTGVKPDAKGIIYKDYTFAKDGASHTVVAKVNFNLADKVTSVTCQATVTSGKTPECKPGIPVGSPECEDEKCPLPGKEHLPKDSPECIENCPVEGKEHLPKDSTECEDTPPELPKTGMGSVLGLFAGTSAIGAVAHRVISNRRNS